MEKRINEIMEQLTLEEKAGLCSGKDFWHLNSVERVGLPEIMVADGPHGLRKQVGTYDHEGLSGSIPATCFPTAVTTASSWDTNLMHEIGIALAEECHQEQVSVILGPGANIKRSPLCGRNFEYISEDPYLSGMMASAMINGTQSQGIGSSLKHFAMNNQEERRMIVDSVVDERAQREIYLKSFEIAVKQSQPWTVMCSYNRVDETYLSNNKRLNTDVLKEEWGHKGLVVTDWSAMNDVVEAIKAGVGLEMPSSFGRSEELIVNAVNEGKLSIQDLDKVVRRVVELILKSSDNIKEGYKYDIDEHMALARKAAAESAVLLKNEDLLPVDRGSKIAIIGEFAKKPRYQGAGSSLINPIQIVSVCDELDNQNINYEYSQGYDLKSSKINNSIIKNAAEAAKNADIAIVITGLPDEYEAEGFDRTHLDMPESHNALIEAVAKANPNTVVILQNGAPITMPWLNDVKSVLECYLGGQACGAAIVDLLYGDVNPSGKIAETFPLKLEDNPSFVNFPGNKLTVEYRESIYVGYRYYDKANKDVLFPFGYGLSYTQFEYSNLVVEKNKNFHTVKVDIKNIGDRDGAEIVQLYVKNAPSNVFKAEKELRGFNKVFLKAGQTETITFKLEQDAFSYYNVDIADWHTESGEYEILICASCQDIKLRQAINIEENDNISTPYSSQELSEYYVLKDEILDISEEQFTKLFGKDLPQRTRPNKRPFTINTMMYETENTFVGKMFVHFVAKSMTKVINIENEEEKKATIDRMQSEIRQMPIRSLSIMGGEMLPKYFSEAIIHLLNGKFIKGLLLLIKK